MGARQSGITAANIDVKKDLNKDKPVAFTKSGAFYSLTEDSKLKSLQNGTNFVYLPSPQLGSDHVDLLKPGPKNANTDKNIFILSPSR